MEAAIKELGLSLNAYQNLARRTRLPTADSMYSLLNLGAEAGELLGVVAKARRKEVPVDINKVLLELGDIMWHVAAVADDYGLSLSEVAEANIAKLNDRANRGVIDGSGDFR